MPDRPLHRRIFAHFRGQAVGYIALFFALGGGYAIAATNTKSIHGGAVKKSGRAPCQVPLRARAAAPSLEPARAGWPIGLSLSERARFHRDRVTGDYREACICWRLWPQRHARWVREGRIGSPDNRLTRPSPRPRRASFRRPGIHTPAASQARSPSTRAWLSTASLQRRMRCSTSPFLAPDA